MTDQPPVRYLGDLAIDEAGDVFALLVRRERGSTRDGKPYYRVTFQDDRRSVVCMIWRDTPWFEPCRDDWKPGQCFKLRGRYRETGYGPQLDLDRIRPVTEDDHAAGFDPARTVGGSEAETLERETALRELCEREIADASLSRLTLGLLDSHREALRLLPGSLRHHHRKPGGWIEHTLSVAQLAVLVAEHYALTEPTRSLVIAGSVLHDIGKVREYRAIGPVADATSEGRLLGHILLGRDLIRDAIAAEDNFDPELAMRLEHLIAAHQDGPESGSPTHALTPEAMVVHLIDELDTRYDMVRHAVETDADGEPFTGTDNPLRRRFYRGNGEP